MKILQVNTVYAVGSTGKIVKELQNACHAHGIDCLAAHRGDVSSDAAIAVSSRFDSRLHGWLSRFTMFKGCFSYFKTRRFLRHVKAYKPDLIHLHNLHGSYIHIGLLMKYIKKNRIAVVFTLHDCWAFTAICSHFTVAECDKWQSGCGKCPQRKECSSSPIDFTKSVWKLKKKWFTGVEDLTVVTPSHWLKELVGQSFLRDYPVKVIHNGIDLAVFHPTPSDFRRVYRLENKKIVLGVAYGWGYKKGLDVMIALAEKLPEDYAVVIVGTDDTVDKMLPPDVISIHRTESQKELSEIYTAADVFVNPTREEVLGLVNLEALACGTPVITFQTGGSPECIDTTCGIAVPVNDVSAMERGILRVCEEHPFSKENCIRRASYFDKDMRFEEYVSLYRNLAQ